MAHSMFKQRDRRPIIQPKQIEDKMSLSSLSDSSILNSLAELTLKLNSIQFRIEVENPIMLSADQKN